MVRIHKQDIFGRANVPTGKGYHPFQILFARMGITVICSSYYMWYNKTEHFPFGLREVRSLLVARGLMGFFGVFGMYCKCCHTFAAMYMCSVNCSSFVPERLAVVKSRCLNCLT